MRSRKRVNFFPVATIASMYRTVAAVRNDRMGKVSDQAASVEVMDVDAVLRPRGFSTASTLTWKSPLKGHDPGRGHIVWVNRHPLWDIRPACKLRHSLVNSIIIRISDLWS